MMLKYLVTAAAILLPVGTAKAEESAGDRAWSATISVASVHSGGSDDQLQGALGITRNFESGYAGMTISHADTGRSPGIIDAVPAKSTQVTLTGGLTRGNWSFDIYASAGNRHFDRELVGPGGSRARIDANGSSFGAGLTISRAVPVTETAWLLPYIAADHFSVDVARSVTTAAGALSVVKETSRGTSGSLGLAFQQSLGVDRSHSVAPYAAIIASSDNSAYAPGTGGQTLANLLAIRGGGRSDIWGELGATAALRLAPRLTLSLGATQTVGYLGPEVLTLQGGLTIGL
jgi:hypothetical protein